MKTIEKITTQAIRLSCIEILSIDLSYRETGYALLRKDNVKNSILIKETGLIKSDQMGSFSFDNMKKVSESTNKIVESITEIKSRSCPDFIIIEMPAFTQSAKSAFLIGALWGAVSLLNDACLVHPSFIKKWSLSKRGDKKNAVLKKVLERTSLIGKMQNNNIVDAIAIGLCFCDMVSSQKRKLNE